MKITIIKIIAITCIFIATCTLNADLKSLEIALQQDLERIEYPPLPWQPEQNDALDVAIIGGGMAGLTAAFALLRQGITNLCIFDENHENKEGPWLTARMKTLRSGKYLMGPALSLPNLTFAAWFESEYSKQAWESLEKAPNATWMDYLIWYKNILNLPIKNKYALETITPNPNDFELLFTTPTKSIKINARKIVLATGRAGFGGLQMPPWVKVLNHSHYAHTKHVITKQAVHNKRIIIVGCGASGFDSAAYALENGARTVTLLSRRDSLPAINKFASLNYQGLNIGFYSLEDRYKWLFSEHGFSAGGPAPKDSLDRVKNYANFCVLLNKEIISVEEKKGCIQCLINNETLECDFIILATGFAIDGTKQKELSSFIDHIALWKDKITTEQAGLHKKMGQFPYLGPHFEFIEKTPGCAPYLKNVHCFNYAASLSHGRISSDIPAISIGALRLAEGIAKDFFAKDAAFHLQELHDFERLEFDEKDYAFVRH